MWPKQTQTHTESQISIFNISKGDVMSACMLCATPSKHHCIMITVCPNRRHHPSSTLSVSVFFIEGGRHTPVTGLIGKHLAPSNQSPSSNTHTHTYTLTHTHTYGFRGNCGAGGRQNDSVYGASQTVVMRGRGLHHLCGGGGGATGS